MKQENKKKQREGNVKNKRVHNSSLETTSLQIFETLKKIFEGNNLYKMEKVGRKKKGGSGGGGMGKERGKRRRRGRRMGRYLRQRPKSSVGR